MLTGPSRIRSSLLVALAATILLPGPGNALTLLESDTTLTKGVDSKFNFALGANASKPGGIVGIVLDDSLVFQRAYGMADVDAAVPNRVDARFYLASASKQFTAMCILLAQEQGLLSVTDPVRKVLPELDPAFDSVTIQNLLNMTSAIVDVGTGNTTITTDSMRLRLLDEGSYGIASAQRPIGGTMSYCNMNYLLLSVVVERVSGKSLRRFAHDEIFAKLGMDSTDIHDTIPLVVGSQPVGYDTKLAIWSTPATTSPATGYTGVVSTLQDLAKWHRNFYANQLGRKDQDLIVRMETPGVYTSGPNIGKPVSNSALGIAAYADGLIPDTYGGIRRVGHTGRWLGFKTATYRYPDLHMSVFVLLNRDDQNPPFQTVADVFTTNVRFANAPPGKLVVGQTPAFRYSATGSPRPTYTLDSGSLPPGLVLAPDGTWSGTPTTAGIYSGVVKATSLSKVRTQAFSIQVEASSTAWKDAGVGGTAIRVHRTERSIRLDLAPLGKYRLEVVRADGTGRRVLATGEGRAPSSLTFSPPGRGLYLLRLQREGLPASVIRFVY